MSRCLILLLLLADCSVFCQYGEELVVDGATELCFYTTSGSCCFVDASRTRSKCFDTQPPFEHLPVPFDVDLPKYFLVRLSDDERGVIDRQINHIDELDATLFTEVVLLIHGLWGSREGTRPWADPLLQGVLIRKKQAAVIFVDWERGARLRKRNVYSQAASNARITGVMVARFLTPRNRLLKANDLFDHRWCIGFSLGAHVCAFIGKELKSLKEPPMTGIIGLDAAGPCFHKNDPSTRLSKKDAEFVIVLHTSWFGLRADLGHVDFYVNGGFYQPGCAKVGLLTTAAGIKIQSRMCRDEDVTNEVMGATDEHHRYYLNHHHHRRLHRRLVYEVMGCSHERAVAIFAAGLGEECLSRSHSPGTLFHHVKPGMLTNFNSSVSASHNFTGQIWLGYRSLDVNFTRSLKRLLKTHEKRPQIHGKTDTSPPYCLYIEPLSLLSDGSSLKLSTTSFLLYILSIFIVAITISKN